MRNGSVQIVDPEGDVLASVPVYGSGIAVANGQAVQVSASALSFGRIAYGRSETLPLTVTNRGAGILTVAVSSDKHSFQVSGYTCSQFFMEPGHSCNVEVEFNPVDPAFHRGTLTLTTNAANNPTVALTGVGVASNLNAPPMAMLSTTYMAFGTVPLGETKTLPLVISNIGGGVVTVTAASISGYSPSQTKFDFAIVGNSINCQTGPTLPYTCAPV
jgi:hypothetical protein